MLISKKNRLAILTYLFKGAPLCAAVVICLGDSSAFFVTLCHSEGVIVAKKDYNLPKHPDVEEVSNLEVIKLMTSLTSRDLVTCRFSWKHYYWFLTEAGIDLLGLQPHQDVAPLRASGGVPPARAAVSARDAKDIVVRAAHHVHLVVVA
ncbi:MAG: hypothetical protein SGPRY_007317, partial [Prymnesium sp.]